MEYDAEKSLTEMLEDVDSINDEFISEYYASSEKKEDIDEVKQLENQFVDEKRIMNSIVISEEKHTGKGEIKAPIIEKDEIKIEHSQNETIEAPSNEKLKTSKLENKEYDLSSHDLITLLKKTNSSDDFFDIIGGK